MIWKGSTIMNIANKITVTRVCAIPFYMFFMLNSNIKYHMEISLVLFILAALTDKLDGDLARKHNLVSDFGKFIDPLADKLLVTASLLCLLQLGKVTAVPVFIILFREFAVTGLRGVAASQNNVIAASNFGKAKTVVQMITIPVLMMNTYIDSIFHMPVSMVLLLVCTLITVISGLDYFYKNKAVFIGKM